MPDNIYPSATNPNDDVGGGGCVCYAEGHEDCVGPYVVMPLNDMEPVYSPHVVMCRGCVERAKRILDENFKTPKVTEVKAPKPKATAGVPEV